MIELAYFRKVRLLESINFFRRENNIGINRGKNAADIYCFYNQPVEHNIDIPKSPQDAFSARIYWLMIKALI